MRLFLNNAFATTLAICAIGTSIAQSFPTKPITVVNTQAAGGPTDVTMRYIAQKMAAASTWLKSFERYQALRALRRAARGARPLLRPLQSRACRRERRAGVQHQLQGAAPSLMDACCRIHEVFAQSAPSLAQSCSLGSAERRRVCRVQRQCIVEPGVLFGAEQNQLSHFLGAQLYAIHLDVRQLRRCDFVYAPVDCRQFHVRSLDGAAKRLNLNLHDIRIKLRHVVDDGFDGRLELAHSFAVTSQQRRRTRSVGPRNAAAAQWRVFARRATPLPPESSMGTETRQAIFQRALDS